MFGLVWLSGSGQREALWAGAAGRLNFIRHLEEEEGSGQQEGWLPIGIRRFTHSGGHVRVVGLQTILLFLYMYALLGFYQA